MEEETTVRRNMMNDMDYRPYCGNDTCIGCYPRVDKDFVCPACGWEAKFAANFWVRYQLKVREQNKRKKGA